MVSMALSSPFPGIQEACASACTEEGLSVFSPSWVFGTLPLGHRSDKRWQLHCGGFESFKWLRGDITLTDLISRRNFPLLLTQHLSPFKPVAEAPAPAHISACTPLASKAQLFTACLPRKPRGLKEEVSQTYAQFRPFINCFQFRESLSRCY